MATLSEDIVGGRGLGLGGDSGGGVLTGIILGALLGRGGLGGLGGGTDAATLVNVATKDDLTQQTLGDIKAAIPFNEAQVQLALQGVQASLTQQNTNNTQYLSGQNTAAALAAATNTALLTRDIAAVDTNVDRQSTAIQVAIQSSERNILEVINQNRIKDLEQQLTVSQLRESEQRAVNRENINSRNIEITVSNNQQQAQLQAQRQDFLLNTLVNGFGQIAKATNSNVIVGNTGASTTGAQTASPTNVQA